MFYKLNFNKFVRENRGAVELTIAQAQDKQDSYKVLADSYSAGKDRFEIVKSGVSYSCSLATHKIRT